MTSPQERSDNNAAETEDIKTAYGILSQLRSQRLSDTYPVRVRYVIMFY